MYTRHFPIPTFYLSACVQTEKSTYESGIVEYHDCILGHRGNDHLVDGFILSVPDERYLRNSSCVMRTKLDIYDRIT